MNDAADLEPLAGFKDLVGYRVSEWRECHAEVVCDVRPELLNRSGVLHGGVIVTCLDAAGGYSGIYCAVPGHVRRSVTVSFHVHFMGQVTAGRLTAIGRLKKAGRRLFFTEVDLYDEAGELIASGDGVYRYRAGSESPEGVPDDGRMAR